MRVRFAWRGDRYAHEVSWFDGRDWTDVLSSVEGSPLDAWPASPPLQSLHFESRPGNRELALLVGMAGKSHWSVSIDSIRPYASNSTSPAELAARWGRSAAVIDRDSRARLVSAALYLALARQLDSRCKTVRSSANRV